MLPANNAAADAFMWICTVFRHTVVMRGFETKNISCDVVSTVLVALTKAAVSGGAARVLTAAISTIVVLVVAVASLVTPGDVAFFCFFLCRSSRGTTTQRTRFAPCSPNRLWLVTSASVL